MQFLISGKGSASIATKFSTNITPQLWVHTIDIGAKGLYDINRNVFKMCELRNKSYQSHQGNHITNVCCNGLRTKMQF